MEHLGPSWKHLGGNLGLSELLGGLLGASWCLLGHLGNVLEASWGHIEASGRLLGGLLCASGAFWGLLGRIFGHFRGFWGSAFELKEAHVGLCWAMLGHLRAMLANLAPTWSQLGGAKMPSHHLFDLEPRSPHDDDARVGRIGVGGIASACGDYRCIHDAILIQRCAIFIQTCVKLIIGCVHLLIGCVHPH